MFYKLRIKIITRNSFNHLCKTLYKPENYLNVFSKILYTFPNIIIRQYFKKHAFYLNIRQHRQ